MDNQDLRFFIPDVRDGLTRLERIILVTLQETQREMKGRNVPSVMLYGRVLEKIDIDEEAFHAAIDTLNTRRAKAEAEE